MERDAAEPGTFRRHPGVLRGGLARVERERRRSLAEVQGDEIRLVLRDLAAESFGGELLGSVEALDPDHDHCDLYGHGPLLSPFQPTSPGMTDGGERT